VAIIAEIGHGEKSDAFRALLKADLFTEIGLVCDIHGPTPIHGHQKPRTCDGGHVTLLQISKR